MKGRRCENRRRSREFSEKSGSSQLKAQDLGSPRLDPFLRARAVAIETTRFEVTHSRLRLTLRVLAEAYAVAAEGATATISARLSDPLAAFRRAVEGRRSRLSSGRCPMGTAHPTFWPAGRLPASSRVHTAEGERTTPSVRHFHGSAVLQRAFVPSREGQGTRPPVRYPDPPYV
jgi:hypothetical protein